MQVSIPTDEVERQKALTQYDVLDTAPEQEFDDLTHLAAQICGVPTSALTLVNQKRQWFKSRVGHLLLDTPRDISFCGHAISGNELLLVPDALADERFADNPLVTAGPNIRFYAGVPLVTPEGQTVGTLCVLDTVPRQLDKAQQDALQRLGRQAVALLEARLEAIGGKGQNRQARLGAERQRLTRAAETARQDAEKLKTSEEHYRRLFEEAQDGILVLDAGTGQIENVNPFLCQLLGYAPDDFVGKQLWKIGAFRDIAASKNAFRTLQEQEYIRYDDLPMETKTGQSVSVELVSNVYVAGGKKVIQCNIRDVSERKNAEKKLRDSEANLAKSQQIALLGSWEMDLSHPGSVSKGPLYWSDEVFRIFGHEPGQIEVSYKSFLGAVHPDDRKLIVTTVERAVKEGKFDRFDHRIHWPDGTERIVHEQAQIVLDEQSGKPLRMVGTVQDVTEQKRVEESLLQSNELLRAVTEGTSDAIFAKDLEGRYLMMNSAGGRFLGCSVEEIIGKTDAEILQREAAQTFEENDHFVIGSGEVETRESVVTIGGVERTFLATKGPLRGPNGDVVGVVGISRDITENKKAEQALEATNREIVATWESMSDAFFSLDTQWRFTHVNSQAAQLSHRTPEEMIGRNIWTEFSDITGLKFYSEFHRAVEDQVPVRFEEFYMPHNIWGEVHAYPSPVGLSVYFRDITERKQAEVQLHFQKTLLEAQTETSLDGILVVSEEGKILSYNQRFVQMWGIAQSTLDTHDDGQAIQTILDKLVHPEHFIERVAHLYKHREQQSHEEVVLQDGRIFDRYSAPISSADGSYYGRVWYFRDITERKQAETLLLESQQRLALATESAHIGIWDWDVVADRLVWDAQMFALYGLHEQDFGGNYEAWTNKLHLDDRERASAEMAAALQGKREFNPQFRVVWPSGEVRHIEAYALVQKANDGTPLRVIGVNWDITERKQNEEALRIGQERFEILSHATNDAVWDWNLLTEDLWWNRGFQTLFGYDRKNLEPGIESWTTNIHPDDLERVSAGIYAVIESRQQFWMDEYRFRRADGSYATIFDRGFVIKDENDTPIRMIGSMQDISERKQAENALRESEERFQSIVANVPGMVYQLVMHPDGSLTWPFVSEGFREIYEVGPEILQSEPSWSLDKIHPGDRDEFDRSVAASAETLSPWSWEGRQRVASGKTKWIQAAARPQRLPDGSLWWNGLVLDITARKEAEEQRDHFFTVSLDMLGIVGQDGNFIRINPAFVETMGYSEAELMSFPFKDRVHPDDSLATNLAARNLMKGIPITDLVNRYRAKDGSWRWLEWRSVGVPEQGVIYAAARDITGRKEAEAALLRMRDELEGRVAERTAELAQTNAALQIQIAEREGAEAESRIRARQQEAVAELGQRALMDIDIDTLLNGATALVAATLNVEISTILELMPAGDTLRFCASTGWKSDVSGQIVPSASSSQAGYALTHKIPTIVTDLRNEHRFTPSRLLLEEGIVSGVTVIIGNYDEPFGTLGAHTVRQYRFTQNDVNFLQAMSNVLGAAIVRRRVETEIRQLNEQLHRINEQLRIENVERQMAIGALRDVTKGLKEAKEEAEEAKETAEIANRAKSEFLSRMSHELRTPLNAILGFGQILDKEELSPVSKESIGYILKGGRHLLDLINEVLDIARVEAGRLELSLESVALDDVVPEVCALVQPLATERGISLEQNAAQLGLNYILADRQRLKQVLINLLSNAIKYNCEGGAVEVFCASKPDGRISIAVRDTGMGISPQNIQKLFTPFERLGASSSEVEGTGLGLVLSQRLVTAMGGTLSVESTMGQGTTFTVELQQTTSPQEQVANLPQVTPYLPIDNEHQRSFTVLCIEDNPSHIRLLEVIFQGRMEITLLTAMEGSVGLDLARQQEPDLILLDLNLPDMHGKDVLTRLQQSALTRDIPVVVISADATPHQVERLLAAGVRMCLTKPLDIDRFLHTLDQFLLMTSASTNHEEKHA